MVESRLEPKKLSARDRLRLFQTLCALPKPQFDELMFALDPPKANVPGGGVNQSDRVTALLEWAESAIGPGLIELEAFLQSIIATHTKTSKQYLLLSFDMELNKYTAQEVRAIVELLRKKTGDDSIDVAFFREGSVKVVLSGSPEGLERLRELVESGELEGLGLPPVEGVERVEGDSGDARKARLVKVLRMNDHSKVSILFRKSDLASASYRAYELNKAVARAIQPTIEDQTRASELARLLAETASRNLRESAHYETFLVSTVDRASGLIHEIVRNLTGIPEDQRDKALSSAILTAFELTRNINRLKNLPSNSFDLREADLRGANLRNISLKGVPLDGADFTNADVHETIFGDNAGLTESEKLDLERRGAIINDPPSSDVPSLVLR